MQLHKRTLTNRAGKAAAPGLSRLLVRPRTETLARTAEAYLCVLLGKGAGTGWARRAEIRAASSLISTSRPVLFDVGANIGRWAEAMRQLHPASSLHLFEPQESCRRRLEGLALPNSVVVPFAVSDESGSWETLYVSQEADEIASLYRRGDSYFGAVRFRPVSVTTISIDDYLARHAIETVDFMKVDAEGHDLRVLRGARHALEDGRIRALSFEFGSGNVNSRTFFRDFWELLTPCGYRLVRVLPSGRPLPIREYYEDCEYFRGVSNYVAVR